MDLRFLLLWRLLYLAWIYKGLGYAMTTDLAVWLGWRFGRDVSIWSHSRSGLGSSHCDDCQNGLATSMAINKKYIDRNARQAIYNSLNLDSQ